MIEFGDPRLPARLWSKIAIDADGHWIWTGASTGGPQIRWKVNGVFKVVSVRRLLFEVATGSTAPAIGGCSALCVNPAHATAGTATEVAKRYQAEHPHTHCPQGHEFAVVGVYFSTVKGRRVRKCRVCAARFKKAYLEQQNRARVRRMSPAQRERYERKRQGGIRGWETRRRRIEAQERAA